MSAQPQPRLSPEQYLEIERKADWKHEFYKGRMYAMAGASYRHGVITRNLGGELGNALKGRDCTVSGPEQRVRVSPSGLYTYPDLLVVCGKPELADAHVDTLLNPTLIVEVLSPSTEAYDRGFKFAQYRRVETLQEYALVSQSEPRIEIFRRQPNADWVLSETEGLQSSCHFDSIDCTIFLAEIYDKVTLGEDSDGPRPGP